MPYSLTRQSTLPIDKAELWKAITQFDNINYELMPLAYMTYPAAAKTLVLDTVPLHTTLFTSIILLFGCIPIDLHRLQLSDFKPEQGFWEHSHSLTHSAWKHTRTLQTLPDGQTQLIDHVQFEPRLPLVGYLLLPVYCLIFGHRHKRLQKKYAPKS